MLKVKQKVVVKGGFGSEKPVIVRIDAISTKNDREIIEYTDWDGQDKWAYVSQIMDFNPDDDKETMDKYAIGEIVAVEPEPVKPKLSKSFNMCDECMETNETQDYLEPMYYNIERNVFECINGHVEDPINHFRQDSRDSLFDIVMKLLGAKQDSTCEVYNRKNEPKPEPVKAHPEYTGIISQLTESLDCDADEIVNIVNLLNMTEYWVENKMLDVCEDNDVMRKVLWADLQEFIQKYKPQNLSVEELYVTDKSEED